MCDTFVALKSSTKTGNVIFGKNSDRPQSEVQLITYAPKKINIEDEQVKCTHISIPQVSETAAILLSQPYWMWGAEMGVNEYSVAIGNEAVYSKEPLRSEGLLGMDLLRLGLERSKTAGEAMEIITQLLEQHRQGGNCGEGEQSWSYHNSFIMADPDNAYVLDTADKWWVAEVVQGVRSISNNLSIRGKGDYRRDGIIDHAIQKGYCKDEDDFDFAKIFSDPQIPDVFPPNSRDRCSLRMLNENKGGISVSNMMNFLREHDVGICMHGAFQSTGSQVSELRDDDRSIHWFTGGTIPCLNLFKPYVFPADGFTVLAPGPYNEIDNNWFWVEHANFIKPYKRRAFEKIQYLERIKNYETEIIRKVGEISQTNSEQNSLTLRQEIQSLNKHSWDYAYELIQPKCKTE